MVDISAKPNPALAPDAPDTPLDEYLVMLTLFRGTDDWVELGTFTWDVQIFYDTDDLDFVGQIMAKIITYLVEHEYAELGAARGGEFYASKNPLFYDLPHLQNIVMNNENGNLDWSFLLQITKTGEELVKKYNETHNINERFRELKKIFYSKRGLKP